VKGWRPVEDVIRWGFARAPVVMANGAHDGMGSLRPDQGSREDLARA
jgi:hypothetical protein